ncbi:MAG: addiction module protein [Planctomycetota bacterium]
MNPRDVDKGLSTSEKILRLQDQWDEIAGSTEELDLTPVQIEELQRRLNDHRQNPRKYKTWEEVRAELIALDRHASD